MQQYATICNNLHQYATICIDLLHKSYFLIVSLLLSNNQMNFAIELRLCYLDIRADLPLIWRQIEWVLSKEVTLCRNPTPRTVWVSERMTYPTSKCHIPTHPIWNWIWCTTRPPEAPIWWEISFHHSKCIRRQSHNCNQIKTFAKYCIQCSQCWPISQSKIMWILMVWIEVWIEVGMRLASGDCNR